MACKKVPKSLWDYGLIHQAGILSRIANGKKVQTGIKEMTGKTPDIYEWIEFDFYIMCGGQ